MSEEARSALVLEDDADLGPAIHELLAESGYVTTWVRDLGEARAALRKRTFSVLVVDLMLSGETSRELLHELFGRPPTLPIVLVSAAKDAPNVANEFGIPLVRKPFDIEFLLAELTRAQGVAQARPSP